MGEQFSPEESIRVIQSMIERTKQGVWGHFYFILWGWFTLVQCVAHFLLYSVFKYEQHYLVLFLTVPCFIISVLYSRRAGREKRVKTYVGENMSSIWISIAILFLVVSLLFIKLGFYTCYPFFIMLYGLGAFLSGRTLQFKPLIVGGIVSWLLAIVAIWFPFDYQPLFAATAALFGYIIPGYLMRHAQQQIQ